MAYFNYPQSYYADKTANSTVFFFLLATRPLVQSAVFFGGNFNGGRWPPRHLDERNQRDKKKNMVKKKKRKRTHVHTKGYTSYCRQLTSTVHKKIGAGSYRAARGSYPAARCVSPSFSFSSTAGQRRWDFRKRLPSINCDSHLCTKDRKVINWRKLCVEDQIDCGGREL